MSYETVKEFSRRTGIVDGKVDAILKGWEHYQSIIDGIKVPKKQKLYVPFTPESPEDNWAYEHWTDADTGQSKTAPYWSIGEWNKNRITGEWESHLEFHTKIRPRGTAVMRDIKPW